MAAYSSRRLLMRDPFHAGILIGPWKYGPFSEEQEGFLEFHRTEIFRSAVVSTKIGT